MSCDEDQISDEDGMPSVERMLDTDLCRISDGATLCQGLTVSLSSSTTLSGNRTQYIMRCSVVSLPDWEVSRDEHKRVSA